MTPEEERHSYFVKIMNGIVGGFYSALIVLGTLYGAYSIYLEFYEKNRINISLFKQKIIQNEYINYFEVYNYGDAIVKDDIINAITIYIPDVEVRIKDICTDSIGVNYAFLSLHTTSARKASVTFDLLNHHQSLEFQIRSKGSIEKYEISSRIKGVNTIAAFHYRNYPEYLKRPPRWAYLTLLFGIIITIDAFLLVIKDIRLGYILDHVSTLNLKTDKKIFLETYKKLYNEYPVNFRFVPKSVIFESAEKCLNNLNKHNIEEIKKELFINARASVYYWLRAPNIFFGWFFIAIPLLVAIFYLVYYELIY